MNLPICCMIQSASNVIFNPRTRLTKCTKFLKVVIHPVFKPSCVPECLYTELYFYEIYGATPAPQADSDESARLPPVWSGFDSSLVLYVG